MYIVEIVGSGSSSDPKRLETGYRGVTEWSDNGDGTATIDLSGPMIMELRSFAASAADALNGGSAWSDLTAIQPDNLPLTLVKQDLVDKVKMTYTERMNGTGSVPQGFVVAHDNNTTKGLWRADADTTAEPTKDSADWTPVFEITV